MAVGHPRSALRAQLDGIRLALTVYPERRDTRSSSSVRRLRRRWWNLRSIYFCTMYRNQIALNLWVEGIDAEIRYSRS